MRCLHAMNLNQTNIPIRPSSPSFLQRSINSVAILNLCQVTISEEAYLVKSRQMRQDRSFVCFVAATFSLLLHVQYNDNNHQTSYVHMQILKTHSKTSVSYVNLCINDLSASFSLLDISSSNHLTIPSAPAPSTYIQGIPVSKMNPQTL